MSDEKKIVIKAKDIMRDKFIELDGLTTVEAALAIMKKNNANIVIVNKRNENDEYGLVLLADIAKKVLAKDRSPNRVNIYEIMTKPLISVPPEMNVKYCARLFDKFGLSLAPVMDNGTVVGVVGYSELVFNGILAGNKALD